MRLKVLSNILGRFMLVFAPIVASPILIGLYYSEPGPNLAPFVYASLISLIAGFIMKHGGENTKPSVKEALTATVLGWFVAVSLGSIPLLPELGVVDAGFEAVSGLTTSGISIFLMPEELPHSILFWRALMQWVGGLGILTFFIAVIRESGGISRRLFSAETHKTDAGSIRPSLKKSIIDLWRVYGFVTSVIIGTFIALGMPVFDAVAHAFSTISTGGFSTTSQSLSGFSPEIQAATVPFMFVGGVNFVILYQVLRGKAEALRNAELKTYSLFFAGLAAVLFTGYMGSGSGLLDAAFQSAAVVSSTGFSTASFVQLSTAIQFLVIGAMFVGGSVGSTAGGLKVFRIKTMVEVLRRRVRSYSLPETAVNEPKIDGSILKNSTVRTVSALFFTWLSVVFFTVLITLVFDGVSVKAALSGAVSSAGNMGPVYMSGAEITSLSPLSKLAWMFAMLAGRLEMLPLLAIFNRSLLPTNKQ